MRFLIVTPTALAMAAHKMGAPRGDGNPASRVSLDPKRLPGSLPRQAPRPARQRPALRPGTPSAAFRALARAVASGDAPSLPSMVLRNY